MLKEYLKELIDAGVRVTLDSSRDKLGAKIRKAELNKVPHMIVIGKKEAEQGLVSVRSRIEKQIEGNKTVAEFIADIEQSVKEKRLPVLAADKGK